MKKILLIALILTCMSCGATAGLLSGSSSGFVEKKGELVVGSGGTFVMFGTPFSSIDVFCNYGIMDNLNIFGRIGAGSVDYSVTPSFEPTAAASIYSFGAEYNFFRSPELAYNMIAEYENAAWGMNNLDNKSSTTSVGFEFVKKAADQRKYKVRLAAFFFNAGDNAGPKITSTTKYGIVTINEYGFSDLLGGYFEGGILGGDPEGVLFYFGGGLTFNFLV